MALGDTGPAPYMPVNSVMIMIELYREKTIALPITTATIERAGVEASLARRTLAGMKQLDLLDEEGNPTDTFKKIKVAPTDQYQEVLAEWLREVYKPIFTYADPADPVEVKDQFRHYEPSGMRGRMVTLFLGLCSHAGLIDKVPPLPRKRASSPRKPSENGAEVKKDKKPDDPPPPPAGEKDQETFYPPQTYSDLFANGDEILINLGDLGAALLVVNVKWLELPEETFTTLRKVTSDLKGLAAEQGGSS